MGHFGRGLTLTRAFIRIESFFFCFSEFHHDRYLIPVCKTATTRPNIPSCFFSYVLTNARTEDTGSLDKHMHPRHAEHESKLWRRLMTYELRARGCGRYSDEETRPAATDHAEDAPAPSNLATKGMKSSELAT
jgi:hypothetical protein